MRQYVKIMLLWLYSQYQNIKGVLCIEQLFRSSMAAIWWQDYNAVDELTKILHQFGNKSAASIKHLKRQKVQITNISK